MVERRGLIRPELFAFLIVIVAIVGYMVGKAMSGDYSKGGASTQVWEEVAPDLLRTRAPHGWIYRSPDGGLTYAQDWIWDAAGAEKGGPK